MGANPDSDEYEEDDAEEVAGDDDLDLDRAIKDMEIAKRRAVKAGEPAWRRLEQRLEQKHTAELISDFEDYDISGEGDGDTALTARLDYPVGARARAHEDSPPLERCAGAARWCGR
jgi:hypothetical protein